MSAKRKPKFKVGQIVAVKGSETFRSFTGSYWVVGGSRWDKTGQFVYHDSCGGPWVAEKMLRPLTKREAGR